MALREAWRIGGGCRDQEAEADCEDDHRGEALGDLDQRERDDVRVVIMQ